MFLSVTDSISKPWSKVNEDILGGVENVAWVLDGATGLGGNMLVEQGSDASWFVSLLNRELERWASNRAWSLKKIVKKALSAVYEDFKDRNLPVGLKPYELPSASLAITRLKGGYLEAAVVGDCKIHINKSDGMRVLGKGTRLEKLDNLVIDEVRRLASSSANFDEIRQRILPVLRRHRSLMNSEGGYSIISVDPESADKLRTKRIPLQSIGSVMLASDGFYRLCDTFGIYDDKSLFSAALRFGLEKLYEDLRKIEETDINCVQYPRLKPKDDVTALILRLHRSSD